MDQQLLRFVRLSYASGPGKETPRKIPVLVFEQDEKLHVVIRSGWEEGISALDREYLSELMADWRCLASGDIAATLDQLAELSIGPLRATSSGVMKPSQIASLSRRVEAGAGDIVVY